MQIPAERYDIDSVTGMGRSAAKTNVILFEWTHNNANVQNFTDSFSVQPTQEILVCMIHTIYIQSYILYTGYSRIVLYVRKTGAQKQERNNN